MKLAEGTHVLATVDIDIDAGNGNVRVHPWAADVLCVLPMDDATVERLARTGHDAYWAPYENDDDLSWDGPTMDDETREDWRRTIRAIFRELMGDGR